jgi:F-type H+-transporting ATPase subunit b
MRIRTLIASVGLVLVAFLGMSTLASAAATAATAPAHPIPVPSGSTEQQKCIIEAYNSGSDVADCYTAQSPIIPDATDLIWGGAAFVILLLVMWKLALPALKTGMESRSERIRADLARADTARVEAEDLLATYQQQVADSKAEATRIIEDARATAEGLKADLQRRAEAEIAELRQRAQQDIEAAKAQAIADLTGEVATLAIGAAEVVVQKNLDRATQQQLIENYISQVGSSN